MNLQLKGKNVLVTGGTRNIGKFIATVFAEEGCNVAISYHGDEGMANQVSAQIMQDTGQTIVPIKADVSIGKDVTRMFDEAIAALGPLDILVNNAGHYETRLLTEMEEEEWDRVINLHLKALYYTCKRMVSDLKREGRPGRIVNVCSKASMSSSTPGRTHYNAAKGGALMFTKSLAREVTRDGIIVNGIMPGIVKERYEDWPTEAQQERVRQRVAQIPIGRQGHPRDMANMVAFLASPCADFAVGSIVDLTGGMLL